MDMTEFDIPEDWEQEPEAATPDFFSLLNLPESATLPPAIQLPDQPVSPWPPRMSFDLALGDSTETILERYAISPEQFERYALIPAFRREISEHRREIHENGVTFRQKAKIQAELYLEDVHDIITNTVISPAVRLDAIKSVVKWADLEPKQTKDAQSNTVPQFNIQINL